MKEYEKYLGLPAMVGKNKRASLNYIKERVWNKLQGWKEQLLSQARREVLLKVVVQAIPTFAMSCFKLPVGLCHDIEMLIRKFWWGQRGEQRKIHWKNWEVMCQPKDKGGLGFKDLVKFNEAMRAKQVWRLLHDQSSLFFQVFKAKYFPHGTVLDAKKSSGSYVWQSILKARSVIEAGIMWRVRDGSTIWVYWDKWLPGNFPSKICSPQRIAPGDVRVAELIDQDTKQWDGAKIDHLFLPFEAAKIKSIPLCTTNQADCIVWPRCRDGAYSVKSGYQLLCELDD